MQVITSLCIIRILHLKLPAGQRSVAQHSQDNKTAPHPLISFCTLLNLSYKRKREREWERELWFYGAVKSCKVGLLLWSMFSRIASAYRKCCHKRLNGISKPPVLPRENIFLDQTCHVTCYVCFCLLQLTESNRVMSYNMPFIIVESENSPTFIWLRTLFDQGLNRTCPLKKQYFTICATERDSLSLDDLNKCHS